MYGFTTKTLTISPYNWLIRHLEGPAASVGTHDNASVNHRVQVLEPYLFQGPQIFPFLQPLESQVDYYWLLDPLPRIYLHLQKGEKPHLHSGTGNRPFVFDQSLIHYVNTICHSFNVLEILCQKLTRHKVSSRHILKMELNKIVGWISYLPRKLVQVDTKHRRPHPNHKSRIVLYLGKLFLTMMIKPDPCFVWTPKFLVPRVKIH